MVRASSIRAFAAGNRARRDQRRNQGRSGDAVGDRAAHRDEAQQREQGQRKAAERDRGEDRKQRRRAQRFRAGHQHAAGDAVGQQPGRNREQDERQRQRGLQQPGLAFADTEQQHGDDGCCGQCNLFGGLRGEVGPGEPVEGCGQAGTVVSGHGETPNRGSRAMIRSRGDKTHPLPDRDCRRISSQARDEQMFLGLR